MLRSFDFAANLSLLFRELPLLDRFAAARAAGFDAVELQFPYDHRAADLARSARRAGVRVVLVNGPAQTARHPAGIACRPDCKDEFRAGLDQVREYACALQAQFVNVLAGRPDPEQRSADCEAALIENLLLAQTHLAPANVLLEVLNPHDAAGYLADNFDAALSILARCEGRIGLQFDTYHAARLGLNPAHELQRLRAHVRHVQFADAPGRHEPGTGAVDFVEILQALAAIEYEGWVSAEYHPSADTLGSLAWLREWRARVRTC